MAKTDTNLSQLIINKLTSSQYYAAVKNENEIYATTDGNGLFLGTTNLTPIDNKTRTNCITEIPQDIKLELNDGTLTLKAGSKVYVPNGAGVFDVVNIASDVSATRTDSQDCIAWYNSNYGTMQLFPIELFYSGSTAPSQFKFMFWYDTENNKCKVTSDSGSTWVEGKSFPLCVVSTDGTKISAIKQVFNGFGYIGSTVFTLPGVKGLIPNGRNDDGSLKNIEFVVSTVMIKTIPSNSGWHYCLSSRDSTTLDMASEFYIGSVLPNNAMDYSRFYNINTNEMYLVVSGKLTKVNQFVFPARIEHLNSGDLKITSMQPLNVFRALDYNDKSTISGWGMPSSRYVDLNLGASGATYTAPANGYFTLSGTSSAVNQFVNFVNTTTGLNTVVYPSAGFGARIFLPAKKGDKITSLWTLGGEIQYFRFIYAEGEN